MLKIHLKSLLCFLLLGILLPFHSLYGEDVAIKKNEYYLIIDRDYMDSIVNNTEQLNFTSCEGPPSEVEEIRKNFASSFTGPAEVKENEEISRDVLTENPEGTVPLPTAGRTSQLMNDLLRNIEKPMNLSPETPVSDLDLIRKQIARHWIVPAGMKEIKNASVDIKVKMNPDATVRSATIVNSSQPMSNPLRKKFVDSALEAVHKAGPLNLPRERYDQWKTIVIRFDPQYIL